MGITGNNTVHNDLGQEDNSTISFEQPGWQISLWAILYISIVIASMMGNITVIWIILAHKRMRTVTNYFIVNLAVSDIFLATFNTIFNFIYASHNVWYFDKGFCRFLNLFPISAIFASVYTMTAVAADRYMAIMHPFRPRFSARTTKVMITVIWLAAIGLAFPQCFYADVIDYHGRILCFVDWPNNEDGPMHHVVYHIVVIVLIYMLPLTFMFVTYSVIGVTLWGRSVPGDQINLKYYEYQIKAKKKVSVMLRYLQGGFRVLMSDGKWKGSVRSKMVVYGEEEQQDGMVFKILRKILIFFPVDRNANEARPVFVKTMIMVVITFAICWLPFHMYFLLGSFVEDIYKQKYIQQVYLAIFLLAMSSTVFNPLIYCCRNQTCKGSEIDEQP